MNFMKHLSELNLWYIPIIVVCVLLLLGFWTGFWRGWKSSLYFMVWNLIGFYVALYVLDAIYDPTLKNMAKNWFSNIEDNLGTKAFDDFFVLFRGWLILMMVLLILSVWNFIAWLVHLFFKKRFQQHLKDNKKAGKSNASSRLLGGLFGVVAVIPTSASAMASSTIISSNSSVNKSVDKFVNAMTFGKVNQVSEDWDAIYGLTLSASSARNLTLLLSGNVGDTDSVVKTMISDGLDKNAPSIVKMFNNPKSAAIAEDVIAHQFATLKYEHDPKDPSYPNDDVSLKNHVVKIDQVKVILTGCPEIRGIFKDLNDSGKVVFDRLFKAGDDFKNLLTDPNYQP